MLTRSFARSAGPRSAGSLLFAALLALASTTACALGEPNDGTSAPPPFSPTPPPPPPDAAPDVPDAPDQATPGLIFTSPLATGADGEIASYLLTPGGELLITRVCCAGGNTISLTRHDLVTHAATLLWSGANPFAPRGGAIAADGKSMVIQAEGPGNETSSEWLLTLGSEGQPTTFTRTANGVPHSSHAAAIAAPGMLRAVYNGIVNVDPFFAPTVGAYGDASAVELALPVGWPYTGPNQGAAISDNGAYCAFHDNSAYVHLFSCATGARLASRPHANASFIGVMTFAGATTLSYASETNITAYGASAAGLTPLATFPANGASIIGGAYNHTRSHLLVQTTTELRLIDTATGEALLTLPVSEPHAISDRTRVSWSTPTRAVVVNLDALYVIDVLAAAEVD